MSSSVWTRALLSVTTAAVITTAAPSIASAGEYHVYGCRLPNGTPAPINGWEIAPADSSEYQTGTPAPVTDPAWQGWVRSCAASGGFGAVIDQSTSTAGAGTRTAAMRFLPGGGLKITRGSLLRAMTTYGNASATIFYLGGNNPLFGDPPLEAIQGTASLGNMASPLSPANRLTFPFSGTGPDGKATQTPAAPIDGLRLRASCWATDASCGGGSTIQVFSSDLVLSDPIGPTVDLAGGTIIEEGKLAERTLRGNETVTVSATDAGIGVDRIRVEVDGQTLSEGLLREPKTGESCRFVKPDADGLPGSTLVRPCPSTGTGTAAIDTSKIPDGEHQLRVSVLDGTGAATIVANGRVLTRNGDTVGPGSPIEFRGAPNGSTTSETAIVSAGWTSTARPATKSKSTQKKCKRPSYLKRNTTKCQGRPPQPKLARAWSRTKSDEIVGRLVDPAGAPIAGATLDLWSTPGREARRSIGSTTTNANGEFRTTVQRAAGSQQVQVTWRARVGDSVPATALNLAFKIKVGSTWKATNVRRGRTARFKGRVIAGDLVKGGGTIRLQFLTPQNGWSNFDSATIDANGRWSIPRKFRTASLYRMRVIVDDSPAGLYDGRTGEAKTVRVR